MLDNNKPQTSFTCAPPPSLKLWRQIELISEGEVGQRLGSLGISPVGKREAVDREETLHGRRSGSNAEVLPSHASRVGEALYVISPPVDTIPARCAQIRYITRKTSRDRGDTLGLGRYTYIYGWGHHYPSAVNISTCMLSQHKSTHATHQHSPLCSQSAAMPSTRQARHCEHQGCWCIR